MKQAGRKGISPRRIEFSDALKATIYVRDRATCCFSGANLWLLDSPLRPGYQRDWVDHVIPSAQGGITDIANGVCASHAFNAKKRHNTADNLYLFEEGIPTWRYWNMFGPLTAEQDSRLKRMSNLRESDWYFNRAIGQILLGFDYRCHFKRYGEKPSRDDHYWFGAAYRKIEQFRLIDTDLSMEERGIITSPDKFARLWISVGQASSKEEFLSAVETIYPYYLINFEAWACYFYDDGCNTPIQRKRAARNAEKTEGLTDDTLKCILDDYALRNQNTG